MAAKLIINLWTAKKRSISLVTKHKSFLNYLVTIYLLIFFRPNNAVFSHFLVNFAAKFRQKEDNKQNIHTNYGRSY